MHNATITSMSKCHSLVILYLNKSRRARMKHLTRFGRRLISGTLCWLGLFFCLYLIHHIMREKLNFQYLVRIIFLTIAPRFYVLLCWLIALLWLVGPSRNISSLDRHETFNFVHGPQRIDLIFSITMMTWHLLHIFMFLHVLISFKHHLMTSSGWRGYPWPTLWLGLINRCFTHNKWRGWIW